MQIAVPTFDGFNGIDSFVVSNLLNLPDGAKGTTTIESKTNFLAPAPAGSMTVATATPVTQAQMVL